MGRRGKLCIALAAILVSAPAGATGGDLVSSQTFSISGDLRLVGAHGERSWLNEGFGKLRAGGSDSGNSRLKPELGALNLIWQPRAGFAWSATVVGTLQGGERTEAGLSEAFISYKPLRRETLRLSARAGLMWPPASLEHGGADWHVLDTVTPSAINSWIGEEVRPLAVEGTVGAALGDHDLSLTGALMAANDTAGALLTLRGWALHDRRTLAFHRQPLPPLVERLVCCQPQYSTPLLDVDGGFARRPGYYVKLSWRPPVPVRFEAFHFDNRADPEAVNDDLEWGWRTRFDNVGLVARLGPATEIKAQALRGNTRMGFEKSGQRWIDADFRSAFLLGTQQFGKSQLSLRVEMFDVRNRGRFVTSDEDEKGVAATAAYRREVSDNLSLLAEVVHVDSDREQRGQVALGARRRQTQVQLVARGRW